jgi:uncharacterized tellurite resistance protein B-like protein
MFLSALNIKEKKDFLELAYHAVASSGEVKKEELEIFESYAYECELPDYQVEGRSVEEIIKKLKKSSKKKLRIIIIELWGVILADEEMAKSEEEFMKHLCHEWDFTDAQYRRMQRWSQDLIDVFSEGYRIVEGI